MINNNMLYVHVMCNYCLCIVLWIFQACQPRWNDALGAGGVATWRCWWSASSGFCRTTTRLFCWDKVWTQKWAVFKTLVGWWLYIWNLMELYYPIYRGLLMIIWNYTTQYTSRELPESNRWIWDCCSGICCWGRRKCKNSIGYLLRRGRACCPATDDSSDDVRTRFLWHPANFEPLSVWKSSRTMNLVFISPKKLNHQWSIFVFPAFNEHSIPIGSMVLVYMLTKRGYIDGIHVTIYSSTMDPSWDSKIHWFLLIFPLVSPPVNSPRSGSMSNDALLQGEDGTMWGAYGHGGPVVTHVDWWLPAIYHP